MLYQTTRSTQITVGPKSVLTLYCVDPKSIVFNLCSHISVQGKWPVLSCPVFGGFTGLEGNYWMSNIGGALPPPNLNIGGAGAPQPPQLLRSCVVRATNWPCTNECSCGHSAVCSRYHYQVRNKKPTQDEIS